MAIYDQGLEKNPANFTALTPLSFLPKAAAVYPDRIAVIHGARRFTWREFYGRTRRLAAALALRGVGRGTTVAAMLANTPEMIELHFGPAMLGAVINTLNTRLDAKTLAFMLDHGEAAVLFTDREFSPVIKQALALCKTRPLVIDVVDPVYTGDGELLGEMDYEALLAGGDENFAWSPPADEWDAIALNYTSGTTGNPKGVVFHHRGAHLNALNNILDWSMPKHSVYLWTVPMFHCNGWCFTWTLAANAGTHVCLRKVEAATIFDLIRTHRVTHFCAAPVVHTTLINAPSELRRGITHPVQAMVAGAPPPSATLEGMAGLGVALTHVYGLTETFGPAAVCAKQPEWQTLPLAEQVVLNGRQGVAYLLEEDMVVMNAATMQPVPADGKTIGEIMFRGNLVMKGYLKNPAATEEAFAGGWFHSGDLAVLQPDGYVKIKDRAKDVIISGGENISSQEVEDVLSRHPAVLLAAVVAQPDEKWGEVGCAFIELKNEAHATESELRVYCQAHMARFKVPKHFVFRILPKTATGKIQKYVLREWARSTDAIE